MVFNGITIRSARWPCVEQARLCGLPGKFGFAKVKSGKYPRGSRGREGGSWEIVGRRGKVFMDWNLGTTKLSGK